MYGHSTVRHIAYKLTLTSRPTASTMSCVVCKLNVSTRQAYVTSFSLEQQRTFLSTGAKVKWHESCLWNEGSTGAKVPWNESSWNIRSWGAKVPLERKFHGTKVLVVVVLGTFRSPGANVPRERKFSLWSFRPRERKCRGTKRPVTLIYIYICVYICVYICKNCV